MARPTWPSDGDTNYGNQLRSGLNQLSDGIDAASATLTTQTGTLQQISAQIAALGGGGTPVPQTVLSVVLGDSSVTVKWTLVTGATSYVVGRNGADQYGTGPTEVVVGQYDTGVGTKVWSNLTPGATYQFYVQPLPGGTKVFVNATVTPQQTTGNTTVVTAIPADGQVTVNWTPVTGATGYLVERDGVDASSGIGGGWSTTDPATATSRVFLSLVNGSLYTVSVTPQVPGGSPKVSATATPANAPAATGATTVTAGTTTTSSVVVNWTAAPGATSYVVGRDGTDAAGSGPQQSTVTTTSTTFTGLKPGTTYTFSVTPNNGPKVSVTATTSATVVTPPSGSGWVSGTCGTDISYTLNGAISTWRGERQTGIRFWLNPLSNMLQAGSYLKNYTSGGYNEVLDYAIGGPGDDAPSWADAASGAMDAIWTTQCQGIHNNWGNLKQVQLSMSHELNGDWYPWAVNSGNVNQFKQAWQKFYNIVQRELVAKGRDAKVTINYACGQPLVKAMYPGNGYVDIIGVDFYDMYLNTSTGNIRSDADWVKVSTSTNGAGDPTGPESFRLWALSLGKPISFPEWAISASSNYDYDNPFFIQKMHDFFAANAPANKYAPGPGQIALECYFNTWDQCVLYPTTKHPQSAAKYVALSWGQ